MNISRVQSMGVGILMILSFGMVSPVLAQGDPTSFTDGISSIGDIAGDNGLAKKSSAKEIMQTIVKWLLTLVGTIAVISLIYGGFLYVTSQGEEDATERAKHIILYSVIGIIIIGISAIVVNVVISITQL